MQPAPRIALLFVCALLAPGAVYGDTFTVDMTGDMGAGTLRQAVIDANAMAGPDIIDFTIPDPSTITLATALSDISEALTIDGGGLGITLTGTGSFPVLNVLASATSLTIQDSKFTLGATGLAMASGLTLTFEQTMAGGTFTGVISGAGGVEKTGPETLTLSGANTYTGGTTVTDGRLIGNATSLQGNIGNNATLEFNQTTSGTYAGVISGTGAVEKTGAGRLSFTGANTYSGGTNVLAGRLAGSTTSLQGTIDVAAGAVLEFSQTADGTYLGTLTGAGTAEKAGAGDLELTGAADVTVDAFNVLSGSLSLNDPMAFQVTTFDLAPNASLRGTNATAANISGTATLRGIVEPRGPNLVGALSTDFDATFASGSTFRVDVDGGAADLFEANTVMIDPGANLQLVFGPNPAMANMAILRSTVGPLTGSFDFDQDFFFFDVTLTQTAMELQLAVTATGGDFSGAAQTPNQAAVAQVLDDAQLANELTDVFDAIRTIESADVPDFLDALSGEGLSSLVDGRLAAKRRLDRALEDRVRGFAARHPAVVPVGSYASFRPDPQGALYAIAPGGDELGLGAWLDGYGVFGDIEGSGGAADVEQRVYGTTLGADFRASEHFFVGLAGGYARLEPSLDGRRESARGDLVQGALFGSAVWQPVRAAAWGRFAWGDYETKRRIRAALLDRTAKGSFEGLEYGGHGELGVALPALFGVVLEPFAAIDFARLEQDGFTETGATTLNLSVPSQSWSSLTSGLGATLHAQLEMEGEATLVPALHARWVREYGDTDRRVVPTLTGNGASYAPSIRGADVGRNALLGGISWTVTSPEGLHVFGDYEVGWNPDQLVHSVELGFRFVF